MNNLCKLLKMWTTNLHRSGSNLSWLVVVKAEYLCKTSGIGTEHSPCVAKCFQHHAYSIQFLHSHNLKQSHLKVTGIIKNKSMVILSSELTAKSNRTHFVWGLDYAITYLLMSSTMFHGKLQPTCSKIETASSCNNLVPNYQSALGDHWEDYNLNLHQFKNFMSEDHRHLWKSE